MPTPKGGKPRELVHHKNENKSDNRVENLEVREFGEHTAEHHTGSHRDAATKKSLEAFALMRGELKRERLIKSELLAALEGMLASAGWRNYSDDELREELELGNEMIAPIITARAAISKARTTVEAGQ